METTTITNDIIAKYSLKDTWSLSTGTKSYNSNSNTTEILSPINESIIAKIKDNAS